MSTLQDVLALSGYKSLPEQVSYCKLLALQHCFDNLERQSSFKPGIIDDENARLLLATPFPSLESGLDWLDVVTGMRFLRPTYDMEGVGASKEKQAINTSEWVNHDDIDTENLHDDTRQTLYEIFSTLGLIHAAPLPPPQHINHVIMISSLESHIKERIDFLGDFSGVLYFISGARGVFNSEPSLAAILADWFHVPEKQPVIQSVLDQHQAFSDPYNWTQNLSGLKQEILNALDLTTWCDASRKSWYYRNPHPYDEWARMNGRGSLRDWPVAMDLLEFHIKQKQKTNPAYFQRVELISLAVLGQNNKLPLSEDFIQAWSQQYGDEVFATGQTPLFLVCNTTHRIRYLAENIVRNQAMRHHLVQHQMQATLQTFIGADELQPGLNSVYVSGPGARTLSLRRGLDVLARSLWPLRPRRNELIAAFLIEQDTFYNPDVLFIKQMQLYQQQKTYMLMAHAALNLAIIYHQNKDWIKTSGLFNFILAMFEKTATTPYPRVTALLSQAIAVNMIRFIRHTRGIEHSVDALMNNNVLNQARLQFLRQIMTYQTLRIQPEKEEISALYDFNFRQLKQYLVDIIQQSKELLAYDAVNLFFGYLGSNSSQISTPWSDIEFYILTHMDSENVAAKNITKMMLLIILNLRETNLRSLGIRAFDHHGHEHHLVDKAFDALSCRGFSFDMNDHEKACMTPLGAKFRGNVLYRLIGTPEFLSEFITTNLQITPYFLQIFLLSSPLAGDERLYLNFKRLLYVSNHYDFPSYNVTLLHYRMDTYLVYLNKIHDQFVIDHKDYFYRPLMALIDSLYLMTAPSQQDNPFEKLELLQRHGLINSLQKDALEKVLIFVLYLRMKEHCKWQENRYLLAPGSKDSLQLVPLMQQVSDIYHQMKQTLDAKEGKLQRVAKEAILMRRMTSQNSNSFFHHDPGSQMRAEYSEKPVRLVARL